MLELTVTDHDKTIMGIVFVKGVKNQNINNTEMPTTTGGDDNVESKF